MSIKLPANCRALNEDEVEYNDGCGMPWWGWLLVGVGATALVAGGVVGGIKYFGRGGGGAAAVEEIQTFRVETVEGPNDMTLMADKGYGCIGPATSEARNYVYNNMCLSHAVALRDGMLYVKRV